MDTRNFIFAGFNVLLGRDPDLVGLKHWVKKFKEGITRDEFLSCLISSAEFQKNRPHWYYDPQSKSSGMDISDLIEKGLKVGDNVTFAPRCHVLAHDESMKTAPGFIHMDTNYFIFAGFNVLLGRDPDPVGLKHWIKKFKEGITRDEFLSCLISSAEFQKNRPHWYYDPQSKSSGMDISDLIEKGLRVGNNCTVHFDTILDPSYCHLIEIGDNVTFAPRCHVLAHDGSMKTALGFTKIGRVIIENDVFIGAGAIILPNVRIGKDTIIGAGSVVTHNIPEKSIVAGNPAKVLCSLDSFLKKHLEFAKIRKNEEIIDGFGYIF